MTKIKARGTKLAQYRTVHTVFSELIRAGGKYGVVAVMVEGTDERVAAA